MTKRLRDGAKSLSNMTALWITEDIGEVPGWLDGGGFVLGSPYGQLCEQYIYDHIGCCYKDTVREVTSTGEHRDLPVIYEYFHVVGCCIHCKATYEYQSEEWEPTWVWSNKSRNELRKWINFCARLKSKGLTVQDGVDLGIKFVSSIPFSNPNDYQKYMPEGILGDAK